MPSRWITIMLAVTFAGLVAACGEEDDDDNGEENGQLHQPATDVGFV